MVIVTAAAMLSASGCKQQQPAPPDAAKPAQTSAPTQANQPPLPAIDSTRYDGPKASVQIQQLESSPVQHVAAVEVITPTGGWTLTLDQGAVVSDTAKLFYTLEKPGDGEMVIQSLVTLRDRYVNSEKAFAHAEVYIHVAQRGVSTYTTNYRLAASK